MNGAFDSGFDAEQKHWDTVKAQYRASCESPGGGVNFLPQVWQKIEARKSRTLRFERASRNLFAAAVALSLLLGAFLAVPGNQPSAFYSDSFVEHIATANASANGTFFEPVRLELNTVEQRTR